MFGKKRPRNAQGPEITAAAEVDPAEAQTRAVDLWQLGENLYVSGRLNEAVDELKNAEAELVRFPELRKIVFQSSLRRNEIFLRLKRYDDALAAIDYAFEVLATDPDPLPVEPRTYALKPRLLVALKRDDEAYFSASEAIEVLAPFSSDQHRSALADLEILRGQIARRRGDHEDAAENFREAVGHLAGLEQRARQLSTAMLGQATMLEQTGHQEEALVAYDAFLIRFESDDDPEIKAAAAAARARRAFLRSLGDDPQVGFGPA